MNPPPSRPKKAQRHQLIMGEMTPTTRPIHSSPTTKLATHNLLPKRGRAQKRSEILTNVEILPGYCIPEQTCDVSGYHNSLLYAWGGGKKIALSALSRPKKEENSSSGSCPAALGVSDRAVRQIDGQAGSIISEEEKASCFLPHSCPVISQTDPQQLGLFFFLSFLFLGFATALSNLPRAMDEYSRPPI